jgi:DNA-binding NarL/FixJ family response regulator
VTTILIVDDDPRFRSQARRLLEADGFVIVGDAVDGASGIDAAGRLRPALVLVDVGLPDMDGFQVATAIAAHGSSEVVLTSSRDARSYGRRVDDGPSLGFLPKEQVSGAAIRALTGRR